MENEDELKNKVLSGYWYEIGSSDVKVEGKRNVITYTGYGGAKMFIDACRKEGIPDNEIAEIIFCYTDMGKFPLSVLNVKKLQDGE